MDPKPRRPSADMAPPSRADLGLPKSPPPAPPPAKRKVKWFDLSQSRLLHDTMKVPARNPRFPLPSADSEEMYAPSVDQLKIFQAGFLNRLTRADLWKLHYVVLTENQLHFFTGTREDCLGHHEFQIPLRMFTTVEDGPALRGEYAKHATIQLSIKGTDKPVVLCAYNTHVQQAWKECLEQAVDTCAASMGGSKSVSSDLSTAGSDELGAQSLSVLAVTCVAPAGGDQAASPAWGSTVVRISPAWGDTMTCRLEQGGHVRVWLSNGTVCSIDPHQKRPTWRDARTLAPVEQPGYRLGYSLQGVSLGYDPPTAADHKQQVKQQQAAYAVLVVLLNLALWGAMSPATAYWSSVLCMAAALACGALPGPSKAPSAGRPSGPVVKLQLLDCEPDYESYGTSGQELQPVSSSLGTRAKEGEKAILAKVDSSKLEQLQRTFPGESDVKLARFLIARKHSVDDAITMCRGDTELRRNLGAITNSDLLPFFKAGLVQFLGSAIDGTPLVYVKLKNLDNKLSSVSMQKLVLHVCDMAAALCPEQQCMTVLADLTGFSMSKNVDFQKTKDCVAVLNACLPEVLRRVFVVNAPFVFQAVWGFVQALIDAATADKVRVLSARSWPMMLSFIDAELLPKEFGGANALQYDGSINSEEKLNWGNVEAPPGF